MGGLRNLTPTYITVCTESYILKTVLSKQLLEPIPTNLGTLSITSCAFLMCSEHVISQQSVASFVSVS